MANSTEYSARLNVDYPKELDRLTTLFRIIWIIPIAIILALITTAGETVIVNEAGEVIRKMGGIAYLALLTDRYPSTVDEQAVHLEVDYPDVESDLNRWLPLVKWLLALPHYIVLVLLFLLTVLAVVAAWFCILLTGRYPRALFDFVVGVWRWALRVGAYAFLLVTDRYPPFSLR